MTLKERFKSIGRAWTGKPEIKYVEKGSTLLGGFIDLFQQKLSDETKISPKLLEQSKEWVYTNVTTLAEAVASIEFELFRFQVKGGELQLIQIEEHEILDLLDHFNEFTSRVDGIYLTEAHMDLAGESFWLLDSEKNPKNIFLLPPDKVELELGDFAASRQIIQSYKYKYRSGGKLKEISYKPEQIIHLKTPNPNNQYRGSSPVEALATTITTDILSSDASLEFYRSGMIGDIAFTTENRMTDEQLKGFKAQLRAAYQGVKNAWQVPVLSGGLKPESLQRNAKEMQFIEQQKWLRDKIMAAFKNTPSSLGITEDVNRANAEASILNWKQTTIRPKMARIVNALNEFLLPRYGDNLVLGFKDPVPEDQTGEIEQALQLKAGGIITRNEARAMLDLEQVEGGDDFSEDRVVGTLEQIPRSLAHVNYKKAFRAAQVYSQIQEFKRLKEVTKPIAKKLRTKPTKPVQKDEHSQFTDKEVWNYWSKQIGIVEAQEVKFQNSLEQFIHDTVELMIDKLDDPRAREENRLLDKEQRVEQAINKFTPILEEVFVLAGNLANRLIGIDDPFIPRSYKTKENGLDLLRRSIELFAISMIDTDVDKITSILAAGLAEGRSVAVIRREIQDVFSTFTKTQAERITRTEVIKASNAGAQFAFEESGVVVGKQWLTAEDDRVDSMCAAMNGEIIELDQTYDNSIESKFGDKGKTITSYDSVPYPPLHPNCRCIATPILDIDVRSLYASQRQSNAELRAKVAELEENIDKRTKAYRDIKAQKLELDKYVEALEDIA